MKIIVGLGNPGEKYKDTRHNVGFFVVKELVRKLQIANYSLQNDWKESKKGQLVYWWFGVDGKKIELVKPQTFMNDSGRAVGYVMKKHPNLKEDDLYIVHDDLDISLGEYKIQKAKGPKEHRGVLSIEKALGTKDFWRVRVGVENRGAKGSESRWLSGEEYVLQRFSDEEKEIIDGVVKKIVEEFMGL